MSATQPSASNLAATTDAGPDPLSARLRDRYLDLLKRTVTNTIYQDVPLWIGISDDFHDTAPTRFVLKYRELGRDCPSTAHTSIGYRRLENIRTCIEHILQDDIPGDLIETGVWRGGALIYMRGVLASYGITDRIVWGADSFEGLPVIDETAHPIDYKIWRTNRLRFAASQAEVEENFRRYDLWDDQVRLLPGWFKDTLPTAPVERLALLRLDGDYYESTTDALTHLYPKLSPGGFVIIDDYMVNSCSRAIHDYRAAHGIEEPIQNVDGWCAYWRRSP
ncbi:MAG: TylF/MycF/NovP-related O-methyltransferase [Litorilinea sp.]